MLADFKQIIAEHSGMLYKIGRAYSNNIDDFKDLYQEMLIQLWRSLQNFKGEAKASTWFYKVALNTAISFHRSQKKQRIFEPISPNFEQIKDEQYLAGSLQDAKIELLYKCINLLPKDQRALILLQLEGKQYEEIAEILGIGLSNVGVKLLRVKKQLKELLIEQGYGQL